MNSEWIQRCLGDLIDIRGGFAYKSQDIDRGDARLLGMGCVSFDKRFLDNGCRRYSGEYKSQHLSSPGDLVIATRQQSENMPILGFPAMIPDSLRLEKVIVGANLYKVENRSEYPNSYLYWLMRGDEYREHVKSRATGSTVRMITKDVVLDFSFYCPSTQESRGIAKFLDFFDDKIELNCKTNENLEAMAKAVFKSWFVDFDPVRAKAEGRSTGLPAEVSDLFPDSLEDSELGEIPSGWKISSLGEEFNWREGKPWNKEDRVERSAISVFGANGSIGFGSRQMGDSRVIFIGKIGSCGAINYHNGLFWATNNTHFISLEENPFLEYARQVLRIVDFSQYIGGSSNPYMPYGNFAHHQIPSPSSDLLRIFCDSVTPLRESIELREATSKSLCALRDALLPKLISGEIRIPDAEKALEVAGL